MPSPPQSLLDLPELGLHAVAPGLSLDEEAARQTREHLQDRLVSLLDLQLTLKHIHWNVVGPMFNTLHLMFEEQYNELWIAVDLIAERIRYELFRAEFRWVEITPGNLNTANMQLSDAPYRHW